MVIMKFISIVRRENMFHIMLRHLPQAQQGILAVIIGFILLFGALGKLGFLQQFLNIIMIVVGIYLLVWGLDKSNLLNKFKRKS
jgi:uncharacterized membrane protein